MSNIGNVYIADTSNSRIRKVTVATSNPRYVDILNSIFSDFYCFVEFYYKFNFSSPSPSAVPSQTPSSVPSTTSPSTALPSQTPSSQPSSNPSSTPSTQPTTMPSAQPSSSPTSKPVSTDLINVNTLSEPITAEVVAEKVDFYLGTSHEPVPRPLLLFSLIYRYFIL